MYINSYSSAGDTIAIIICIICWLFLESTYTTRQSDLKLFRFVNRTICIAAIDNIVYHTLMNNIQQEYVTWIYILGNSVYISLALVFVVFCVYLANLLEIGERAKLILYTMTIPVFIFYASYKLIAPIFGEDFFIDSNLVIHNNYYENSFILYYIYFCIILVIVINIYKKRIITNARKCLQGVIYLSLIIMLIEYIFQSSTFSCVSFTFPMVGALFLFHYNAYDIKTGTLDSKSFNNYILDMKDKPYAMFCLYLKNFNIQNNKKLSDNFIQYTEGLFKEYCMFRISDNRIVLVYLKYQHDHNSTLIELVKSKFEALYKLYNIPYKLIYINANGALLSGNDYLAFNDFVNIKTPLNTYYECNNNDIEQFLRMKLIKDILEDIYNNNDLNDSHIQVYCQPILDVETNTYKTAEALMRLTVHGTIISPDEFIPIAEQHGYIHFLSKIVLNKVCLCIKDLISEGYTFDRISVNFSSMEFIREDFCNDILEIIDQNQIPTNKIAIEITESQNEKEFSIVSEAIKKLQRNGIKFYLDDFGTGYSNFQRIFSLPIDIIKFDRSVTILSGENRDLNFAIKNIAKIFSNAGYKILFEGIETLEDELRCKDMYASYLQGYKYSKPIEIKYLKKYFEKGNEII